MKYWEFIRSGRSIVITIVAVFFAAAAITAFVEWPEQIVNIEPRETSQLRLADDPATSRIVEPSGPAAETMSTNTRANKLLAPKKDPNELLRGDDQAVVERSQSDSRLTTPEQTSGPSEIDEPQRNGEDPDERPRGDRPNDATQFRNLQLQDENGKIALDGLQKAREQMNSMRSVQQENAVASGEPGGIKVAGIDPGAWLWLGPGNIGGRIRSIVIDPVNPNKMWVGSVSGGIWETTNAGGTWRPESDFMANLAVSTMVMDPTNPNVIYAGTGESFAAAISPLEGEGLAPEGLRGDGIFKTIDGGITWNQLPQTSVNTPGVCGGVGGILCAWSYVNRLAISPDGSTILAATVSGIWWSSDGGATWNPAGGALGSFLDLDFDPTNPQNAIASGSGASVYSTDGGRNWQNAAYSPAVSLGGSSGRIEMAYAASSPSVVYISIDETRNPPPPALQVKGDIYKSIDGGQNFTRLNTVNPGNNFLGGQGNYGNIIWVSPQDPNLVIVGGINMYRSTDGGINWIAIANGGNGSAHSDHHMIVAHPGFDNTTNKTVYFSNDGGIYRTDDVSTVSLTSGWTKLNNDLGITQFYGAAGNSAGVIVGGTQDNGTLRYTGNAQDWTSMFGGDGGYSAADPTDANYFYGEYTTLGIVRSTDGGSTSSYIYCNPTPSNINGGQCVAPGVGITDAFNGANFIAPFILDPNDANTMLAGGLSLWRSNDIKAAGLPSWTAIKVPVTDTRPAQLGNANPTSAITVSRNSSDFVVVGHNDGQIFLTFNGTAAVPVWSKIDAGIPSKRFVTRLVIDETRAPNWIYATLGGFAADNVYRSTDFGVTWTDVTGSGATGLPNVPVRSLAINPARPDFIYVGTEVGVFASEDAGATWGLPQGGPANVAVDELFWLNGQLVAATHGRGVYKTGTTVFNAPSCIPPIPECPCFGDWDCPCTWNSQHVPTANDDIAIVCPVHLKPGFGFGGQARNMVVYGDLTLDSDFSATEDVTNFGNIHSNTGVPTSVSCRHLLNSRNPGAAPLGGIISLFGGISASGNVVNSGIMALGADITSNDLRTTPQSTLTLNMLTVRGDLENSGRIEARNSMKVSGNVYNGGPRNAGVLKAPTLVVTAPTTRVKNLSGLGRWEFGTFAIPAGYTARLGSNVTFDITTVTNNGTFDFGEQSVNFKGSRFDSTGAVPGTGILRFMPVSGNAIFNGNGPAVRIASGAVEYQSGGTINESLVVAPGATFKLNTSGTLTVQKNVLINGTLSKMGFNPQLTFNGQTFANNGIVGDLDFITFNDGGGAPVQFIEGTGSWSPQNIQIGTVGSATTVNLKNNITLASKQLLTATGSALNVNNFTLTLTGPMSSFFGKISGNGLVKMDRGVGTQRLGGPGLLTIDPALEIVSGTALATSTIANGRMTIDPGATLSLFGFTGMVANGDVLNNGTLNSLSDNPSFKFMGGTFTNNGVVTGNVNVNFGDFFGPALAQNLAGTGSWAGSPRLLIDSISTTTLQSDLTYNGGNLYVQGRLDTGFYTLSLPCTVTWSGAGDVFGNIRRTNLAACPGGIVAFGNPFTTIQFTSGIPPTEITVNVASVAPAGFPGATTRTYLITPVGGSGYTATLRLHYLDSELNGNDESTLQLWRNNGTNWTPQGATNRNTIQNWVEYTGVTQFSPWTISGPLAPTASGVSVSGRAMTATGNGIRNVRVQITMPGGELQTAITSAFGYYRFDDIPAGNTCVISVSAKRFSFVQPEVILTVTDAVDGLDFVTEAPR